MALRNGSRQRQRPYSACDSYSPEFSPRIVRFVVDIAEENMPNYKNYFSIQSYLRSFRKKTFHLPRIKHFMPRTPQETSTHRTTSEHDFRGKAVKQEKNSSFSDSNLSDFSLSGLTLLPQVNDKPQKEFLPKSDIPLTTARKSSATSMKSDSSCASANLVVTNAISGYQLRKAMANANSIPADRIGSTSKRKRAPGSNKTMADILKAAGYYPEKHYSDRSRGSGNRSVGYWNGKADPLLTVQGWQSKLNTRVIDEMSYETFARAEK